MRVCSRCGAMVEDGIMICPSCRTPLSGNEQVVSQSMTGNGAYQNFQAEPRLGTKWADFLGYFALWLGGLANIVSGLGCFALVGASSAYMLIAVCFLITGVFDFMAAVKIIKRKNDARKFVIIAYSLATVVNLIAIVFALSSNGDITTMVPATIVSILMIFVNNTYFKNRENIFVN